MSNISVRVKIRLLVQKRNLVEELSTYGMSLKKWSTNCPEVLDDVDRSDQADAMHCFENPEDQFVHVLRLQWDPIKDRFSYRVQSEEPVFSKYVFCPSWPEFMIRLNPVTLLAKRLLQQLWKEKYDWDTILPEHLHEEQKIFLLDLPNIGHIHISRFVSINNCLQTNLCGFCDAFEAGYGAVIYLRTICRDGTIQVHQVGSRSRVAPVKTITIPLLELCGPLLLAQWTNRISELLKHHMNIGKIYFWSDSKIVLTWLAATNTDFKIFVANQISKIHQLVPDCQWDHIPSASNPADCPSLGQSSPSLSNRSTYADV